MPLEDPVNSLFESSKSRTYTVEYLENNCWVKEAVQYDKKQNIWNGIKTPEFYARQIRSWYYLQTH